VDVRTFRHLDHGYAVTSHSSQGQTVDHVIVHADTRESVVLLNRRMAYVALSRAREEGMIFTDSKERLTEALARGYDKTMAVESLAESGRHAEQRQELRQEPERGMTFSLSL
jgi:ATP-dependent exoDNAse (exonuclease V) alpha subunit